MPQAAIQHAATDLDLGSTVKAMRPFVPAKDFALSQRFYRDLGFAIQPLGDSLAAMQIGRHSFLLQDYYVDTWAGNFVMHMLVNDVAMWWRHIEQLDLAKRYRVAEPRPPRREDWGLDVTYVFDPSGVLWHIAQVSK